MKNLPICDCLPTSDESRAIVSAHLSSAKSIDALWEAQGDMPVIAWDEAFEAWLDKRIERADELRNRGICTLPWVILDALPANKKRSNLLYFSQGMVNSCAAHGEAFAFERSLLSAIAYGAPLIYRAVNPYVGYWLSSPGNRGGRGIAQIAKWNNENGHYCTDVVGEDNTRLPDSYKNFTADASAYQTAFAYVEGSGDGLVRNVIKCLRADLGVFWGNTTAIRSSKIDSNGVKVGVLGGSWAHATSGHAYRKIGNTEYIFVANSHGKIYTGSQEGDPDDGVWMDADTFARYAASFSTYDKPCVIIAEGLIQDDWSLKSDLKLEFPAGFKRG